MKKIALWAIAILVFTGIAQADTLQSYSPYLPGYDPFPAGDDVVSVTLAGTITGGNQGGIDGADLFERPNSTHANLLNAPIQVNMYWDESAIDDIANNYNPTVYDSGAGDGFFFIYAWSPPNDGDYPWPPPPIASVTVVNNNGDDVPFYSGSNYSTAAFDIFGCGMGPFAPQDCLTVSGQNYNTDGISFEFLAANSDGTPASVDIGSQAAVNAFLSNPDNTYTLFYSNYDQTLGVSEDPGYNDVFTANLSLVTSNPEPATWTLLAMALTGGALLKLGRRRRG
jgi:hypothetical protein